MATVLATRDGIGGNSPPPIEAHKLHIEELLHEATTWLDGDPIVNQDEADGVGKLLTMLREARKGADAQRAAEKKPHDEAAKAVQAAWKPLLERVDLAEQTAKKALAPYLTAQEAEQRRLAEEARIEAERKADEARAAIAAAASNDLAAREAAETLVKDAEKAGKDAARLDKVKSQARTDGRAIGLRSVWAATIVDRRAALAHYLKVDPKRFEDVIEYLAAFDARYGPRTAPGIKFTETRIPA